MPMSNILHLPPIIHLVCVLQPRSILDVGVGMGTYGLLLRQYLDISKDRFRRPEWQVRIEGIEIFEGYRSQVWDYAYDKIIIGDVRKLVGDLGQYDVIICNDILEHVEKQEAKPLIARLLKLSQVVISTTPNREYPQGARAGNEAERHLCLLDDSDFPDIVIKRVTGITNLYVCSSDRSVYPLLEEAEIALPVYKGRTLQSFKWRLRRKLNQVVKVY